MKLSQIIIFLILSTYAYSATFNVSTTAEFRQALSDAATNGEDDTINLADGTYKTTDDGAGTFMFVDNEVYTLTINGSSRENVILSGDNQHQIFNHLSTSYNSRIILENLTFTSGISVNGGAVYIDKKGTILNCIFSDNNATSRGGGFYSNYSVIVTNSTFYKNHAESDGGGFYSYSSTNVTDCNFTENTANQYGGGFRTGSNATTYVSNTLFKNNIVQVNGGGFSSYWNVIIKNSIFENNSAQGTGVQGYGYGGGFASSNASAEIENSIFTNNSSTVNGGGFSIKRYALKMVNTLLVNNTTGIYIEEDNTHEIANSVFKNNSAEIDGAANTVVTLKNNYIDINKVYTISLANDNIYNDINLGFVDESNQDYHLTSSSDLIDGGVNTFNSITIPTTDLDGNPRPTGISTDIGPYEYQPSSAPTIPTDINATDGTFEYTVGISWQEVSNATRYDVYRSTAEDVMGDIVGITVSTSLVDDTIEADTQYFYRVKACNEIGCSEFSEADKGHIGSIAQPLDPSIIMYLLN